MREVFSNKFDFSGPLDSVVQANQLGGRHESDPSACLNSEQNKNLIKLLLYPCRQRLMCLLKALFSICVDWFYNYGKLP